MLLWPFKTIHSLEVNLCFLRGLPRQLRWQISCVGSSPLQHSKKINQFLYKCQYCLTGCLIPIYVSKPKVLVSALIRTWRWRVLKVMLCLLQKFTSSDSFIRAHGWGMWKQLLFPHSMCFLLTRHTPDKQSHNTHQIKEQISASAPPTRDLGMIIKFITFTFQSLTPIICIFALICFDYL